MVDLKVLGTSLAKAGVLHKSFADMGVDEVFLVVDMVQAASHKKCIHCDQWEKVPEAPWWIGLCRIGGHSVEKASFCTLETDGPPF